MHIGVSMWSYVRPWKEGRIDIPGFIREAKRAGAQGVELLSFFSKDAEAERPAIVDALDESGLMCPIFSVGNNFAKLEESARLEELAKIQGGIEEACHLGATIVRVFAGDVAEGIGFEQAHDWIVEGLVKASIYAEEKGVKLALENHGKLAGRGDQVRQLIEEVRHFSNTASLGANPDTGNFLLVNQPSHEAVAQVAELANMVHFKDFKPAPEGHEGFAYEALDGQRFVGTAVGEGTVDLARCIEELHKVGWDGWLSIEYEGEESPFEAVPRSVANARRYLNA